MSVPSIVLIAIGLLMLPVLVFGFWIASLVVPTVVRVVAPEVVGVVVPEVLRAVVPSAD